RRNRDHRAKLGGPLIPAHAGMGLCLFSLWTFAPSACATITQAHKLFADRDLLKQLQPFSASSRRRHSGATLAVEPQRAESSALRPAVRKSAFPLLAQSGHSKERNQ